MTSRVFAGVFVISSALLAQTAVLDGVVVAKLGVIQGIDVEVASDEHRCKTISDQIGRFHCELPPGRYRVVATSFKTLPYRRAAITLSASASRFVYIWPEFPPVCGFVQDPGQTCPLAELAPKEDVQTDPAGADVLVRYRTMERRAGRQIFTGDNVMLTFENLAVYAGEMSCSNPIRTCATTTGSVMVEIGSDQFQVSSVEIDLTARKVVLDKNPTLSKTF